MLAGFYLCLIFLGSVAHGGNLLLAVKGVFVDIHLRVYCQDLVVGSLEGRVDFEEGSVNTYISIVEGHEELHHFLECLAFEAELVGHFAGLKALEPYCGVYPLLKDAVGSFFGHLFNVHTAFGTGHDDVLAGGAVEQYADIILFGVAFSGVVYIVADHHLAYGKSLSASLGGDQPHSDDIRDFFLHFIQALRQFHAPAFSTSTCMNLCFHNEQLCSCFFLQLFRCIYCGLWRFCDVAT